MAEPIAFADMSHLDPALLTWLEKLGLKTDADIRKHGVAEIYATLKVHYGDKVDMDMLAGLQAAAMGLSVSEVPAMLLDDLKRESWELIRDFKANQKQ